MASRKKHVTLTLPTDVLHALLRLQPTMRIVGAEADPDNELVTFTLRAPDAPNGALAMVPEYYHNGRPDPIVLRSVEWVWPDGLTATQDLGLPEVEKEAA